MCGQRNSFTSHRACVADQSVKLSADRSLIELYELEKNIGINFRVQLSIFDVQARSPFWSACNSDGRILACATFWRQYDSSVDFPVRSSKIGTSTVVVCRPVVYAAQTLVSVLLLGTSLGALIVALFVASQSMKTF